MGVCKRIVDIYGWSVRENLIFMGVCKRIVDIYGCL